MPDFYDIAKEKGFHSQAVSYCIRLSPDKKDATQIAEKMIEENIKKGWEKVV